MIRRKPTKGRIIFHIDMNCFYASVEMAYNPKLKGRPVAISGNPKERRGIIITSSYEARAKGVRTTMPLWEAKKLCPELIVLPPDFAKYRLASNRIFSLLQEVTPLVEPVSIDEGYLDVTDCAHDGTPLKTAQSIQQRILDELDLPSSLGIGPNKFLAKMASDMKKPLGITVLRRRDIPRVLWPLPVEEMYGIGKRTAEKLQMVDVYTIGDLAKKDVYTLTHLLGINGERLKNRANGIDPRPVDPEAVHEFKSIGNSKTLPRDTTDLDEIQQLLFQLCETVSRRLKRRNMLGLTVQITLRFQNMKQITRSQKGQRFIDETDDIYEVASYLLLNHWKGDPIRLVGVTVQDLEEREAITQQLDLFTFEKEIEKMKLEQTIQQLTDKYGEDTFKRLNEEKDDHDFRTSFQKDFLDPFHKR